MTANNPTIKLASELIKKQSLTPEDAGCQDLMIARLQAINFQITRLPFDDVENFWAVHGNSGPIFAFAGHTDVVPVGNISDWTHPPFSATIKNNVLYGRGAADMKGSLAAMVTACEGFIAHNPDHNGRIAFLITSDEEGIATNGTVKVIDWLEQQNEKIEWCLVGEPSSSNFLGDIVKNGRRGSLGARLTALGKQGHVAYPHLAQNPIHIIAPALAELINEVWDEGNDSFPATSFQISNINGGTGATNVIPGEVEVVFNFRYSTELNARILQERTKSILNKYNFNYNLEWNLSGEPFLTAKGKLVEAAKKSIHEIMGRETTLSTAGGTSDGRFIAPTGAQVLELGPINATIHQTNENVNCEDLINLSKIYQQLLQNLLIENPPIK